MSTAKLFTLAVCMLYLLVSCGPQAAITIPSETTRSLLPTYTPVPPTLTPTSKPIPDWLAELIANLEELASTDQFSGAVLVAHGGETLLEAAYGLADRSLGIPNKIDTKFNLGSMNKMFTAVAVLQLVESGILSRDDTIIQHIPDYPNVEVASHVTVHQLLSHTSGLGDVFTEQFEANPHQFRSNTDYLPLFVDETLQFQPGKGFLYSNAGYVVLGLIIESVSGQSYDGYIQQHILDPSGMVDTGAFEIDANSPNLAVGYTTKDFWGNETGQLASNADLMPGSGFAAGGGYSTVVDLLRFRNALFNFELLTPESTELLLAGKVDVQENSSYAYGFFDRVVAGQRVVGHGGGAPGVCSSLNMYPASEYTIIVLSNSDDGCVYVLDFLKDRPLK
jgi:D-alanyl-D-alanine carboxypeptidase